MAPGFEGRVALAWPLCSTGLEDEALGAFLLNFDLHGQPHPQGLWGEAAGGPAGRDVSGFLFAAEELARGLRAPAGCLSDTVGHSQLPLSLASVLPLAHFTCKYILQMVPGFSMSSAGNRKKNHCLNLGLGAGTIFRKSPDEEWRPGVPNQGSRAPD